MSQKKANRTVSDEGEEENNEDPVDLAVWWANSHLSKYGEEISNFLLDFCDGTRIAHIIEDITHADLTSQCSLPKTVFQKRQLIQKSLRYLENYRIVSKQLVKREDILWGEFVPTYNLLRIINIRLDNGDLPSLPPGYKYQKKDYSKKETDDDEEIRRKKMEEEERLRKMLEEKQKSLINSNRFNKSSDFTNSLRKPSKYAVGIDIGTCYCRFSVYKGKITQNLEDSKNNNNNNNSANENNNFDNNNISLPSMIVFQGGAKFIGECPSKVLEADDAIVVTDMKRIIGRDFSESKLKDEVNNLPYKVEEDPSTHRPFVIVGQERYNFEQLMSMLLSRVKKTVCRQMDEDVIDAVISVPAFFPNSQRQAIKDAARIAGFNVIRIVNETAASAMAMNAVSNDRSDEKKNIIVFDMGGGKVDASLVTLEGGVCTTLNSAGDLNLGGRDIDMRLASYIIEKLKANSSNDEFSLSDGDKRKIILESEKVKIELSSKDEAEICGIKITREEFEEICNDLFERSVIPVKMLFENSVNGENSENNENNENSTEKVKNVEIKEIQRVVLAGGSSKIPKIRAKLAEFFGPNVELYDIDEGCTISLGAAMQGAIMKGELDLNELTGVGMKDTLPLSLGISQANGVNSIIIPHGTILPAKYTTMATTSVDGQTNVCFDIIQGERKMACDCVKLGHVTVNGIQVAKRCVPKIEIVMEIDESGFLSVNAKDLTTGASMTTSVYSSSNLDEDDILNMYEDAEENKEEDERKCLVASEKAELNYTVNKIERLLKENTLNGKNEEEISNVNKKVIEAKNWMKLNENSDDVDTLIKLRSDLEDLLNKCQ